MKPAKHSPIQGFPSVTVSTATKSPLPPHLVSSHVVSCPGSSLCSHRLASK